MVWGDEWALYCPAMQIRLVRHLGGFPLRFDPRRPSEAKSRPPGVLLLPTLALLVREIFSTPQMQVFRNMK